MRQQPSAVVQATFAYAASLRGMSYEQVGKIWLFDLLQLLALSKESPFGNATGLAELMRFKRLVMRAEALEYAHARGWMQVTYSGPRVKNYGHYKLRDDK